MSVLQVYGSALVLITASLVLGRAICAIAGRDEKWWAAPAVGLAGVIILAQAAIELPGKAVAATCVEAVVLFVAVGFLVWRRVRLIGAGDLLAGVVALAAASVPFLANGRVGLQGVSLDNDTDVHLLLAEALRSSRMSALWGTGAGYPVGPHSLVASLGTAISAPLDLVFAGLLLAVMPIIAMTATGLVAREARWRQVVVGLVCSVAYLFAAYYGEGAFKETIMAALLLAFVVQLEQVRVRWTAATNPIRGWLVVPALVLAAGAFYTYSYLGLAWYALTAVIWLVAEAACHPAAVLSWLSRPRVRTPSPRIVGIGVLGILLLIPVASQAVTFFHSVGASASGSGVIPRNALGNLIGPLSGYEMLGVWLSPDFRMPPASGFDTGQLATLAAAIQLYGLYWCLRRRLFVLPAAALSCVLIWLYARHSQSPYVAAKALVIAAPLVMGMGSRALLTSRQGARSNRILRLGVAAVFCALAVYSSFEVLRNEPVQAPEAGHELAAFHHTIGTSTVLFMGDDDYAAWQLRPAAVSELSQLGPSLTVVPTRPSRPWAYGKAVDFDSVEPSELDKFSYVVTSNSPYSTPAPANFRLVASERMYDLWQRTGPTVSGQTFAPSGTPGAILDCRSPFGRGLRKLSGEATVVPTPVTVPGPGLLAGGSAVVPVPLPKGRWELSIQYVGTFKLDLAAQGNRWTVPAYLGRPGPFFRVGSVTGEGIRSPVLLEFVAGHPSFLTGTGNTLFDTTLTIAATRVPDTRQIVPLSRACGDYVVSYRLG